MATKAKGPSWAPSTYKQSGGGLFDDVDSTILGYEYVGDEAPEGYTGGESGNIPLFLKVRHQIADVEGESIEWFSLGGKARDSFSIDEGGQTLTPLFEGAQMNAGANASMFVASFITAGAPESLFEAEDFALPIEGMGVHLERVPDTRNVNKKKDSKYPPTVLAVTRFAEETKKAWAGGKKAAAKTTATATAKKPTTTTKAAPAADAGDAAETAQAVVLEILAENGGTFNRSKMIVPVSKKIAILDASIKDEVRKLAYSPEFLALEDKGWTYDAKSQVIKAA